MGYIMDYSNNRYMMNQPANWNSGPTHKPGIWSEVVGRCVWRTNMQATSRVEQQSYRPVPQQGPYDQSTSSQDQQEGGQVYHRLQKLQREEIILWIIKLEVYWETWSNCQRNFLTCFLCFFSTTVMVDMFLASALHPGSDQWVNSSDPPHLTY